MTENDIGWLFVLVVGLGLIAFIGLHKQTPHNKTMPDGNVIPLRTPPVSPGPTIVNQQEMPT